MVDLGKRLDSLHRNIRNVVEGAPSKLIETVAENIAKEILNNHMLVSGVRISVSKPNVAIKGSFASLGKQFTGSLPY